MDVDEEKRGTGLTGGKEWHQTDLFKDKGFLAPGKEERRKKGKNGREISVTLSIRHWGKKGGKEGK